MRKLRTDRDAAVRRLKRRTWPTVGDLAKAIDPTTVQTPALEVVDAAVAWAHTTPGARLIVSMPPQEGKSVRVTKTGSLWALIRNPQLRLGIVSYSQALAEGFGREIRNWIASHNGDEDSLDLGLRIARDNGSARRWQLDGHRGGIVCVGIGSGLTGRPLDCFVGSTRILTDRGYTCIRDLYQSGRPVRVLSWNHSERRPEWKPVVAVRRIRRREVLEVITASGRRFTCTPDHRIYTADGYRQAALLRPGDSLLVGWQGSTPGVRDLREGAEVGQPDLPGLLQGSQSIDLADSVLHPVRDGVSADARRAREEVAARAGKQVLLAGVRGGGFAESGKALHAVRRADGFRGQAQALLLGGLPGCDETAEEDEVLSTVRQSVQLLQRAADVLRQGVRRRRALGPDGRCRKLSLQGWNQLRDLVPDDASSDRGTRSERVQGVHAAGQAVPRDARRQDRHADESVRAPHRRGPSGQPPWEPNPALQILPPSAPQVGEDAVSVVRHLRGERHDVYDIQVADNHNFFAEEVLVHNCLVIDDPFADREQAQSAYYRERVWNWWQAVGSTRLAPGAPAIVILTRWHEDDLAGRLVAAEDGERWRVINIPALADHDPAKGQMDPLGRAPGEWLTSARGRTVTDWEAIRIQAGARVFNALYQGRPSPDAGNVWERQWWRRYSTPMWSQHPTVADAYWVDGCDELVMSWDMAFKDTKSSDFVVGQVWARRGAYVYLLDQVHKRLSFTDTLTVFKAMVARWPQATAKYVEDKANGTAIIDTLRSKIPGIVALNPTESKYARANAVAPVVQAGNVFLPDAGIALFDPEELVNEAADFPNGAHDDQVDATSQALAQMLLDGTGAQAWIEYARRKAEALATPPAVELAAVPAAEPPMPLDPVAARKAARDAAMRSQMR